MREGWETRTIGEVCRIRGGGTPSKAVDRYWRGDVPWVSSKDMKSNIISDSIDHISREAIQRSAASLIPKESVLIVVRSGILARTVPIAVTGRDLTINQDLKALCPNGTIDARFLYYFLESKMGALLSLVSRGATVHRLMTEQVRSLRVPMLSLTEQRRIVGILVEVCQDMRRARENAEKNLRNARALFVSELDTAVRGAAARAGEDKTPVSQLLDEVEDARSRAVAEGRARRLTTDPGPEDSVGPFSLPDSWAWRRLGSLTIGISDGVHATPKYIAEGTPFVTVRNLTAGPGISFEDVRFISADDHAEFIKRTWPEKGDILISKDGTIGVVRRIETDSEFSIFVSVALVKPALLEMGAFLTYALSAPSVQAQIVPQGAALKHLYLTDLRRLPIPVPPLAQQKRIVARLDAVRDEASRLEMVYQRKLAALDELKQSLLHQAFSGQM